MCLCSVDRWPLTSQSPSVPSSPGCPFVKCSCSQCSHSDPHLWKMYPFRNLHPPFLCSWFQVYTPGLTDLSIEYCLQFLFGMSHLYVVLYSKYMQQIIFIIFPSNLVSHWCSHYWLTNPYPPGHSALQVQIRNSEQSLIIFNPTCTLTNYQVLSILPQQLSELFLSGVLVKSLPKKWDFF